jgi:hypothetical protein
MREETRKATVKILDFLIVLCLIITLIDFASRLRFNNDPKEEMSSKEQTTAGRQTEILDNWKSRHPHGMSHDEAVIFRCDEKKAFAISQEMERNELWHKGSPKKQSIEEIIVPSKLPEGISKFMFLQYDGKGNLFALILINQKEGATPKSVPVKVYYAEPFFYFAIRF